MRDRFFTASIKGGKRRKRKFLRELERGYSVQAAAEACGVPTSLVYLWAQDDQRFALAWDRLRLARRQYLNDLRLELAMAGDPILLRDLTSLPLPMRQVGGEVTLHIIPQYPEEGAELKEFITLESAYGPVQPSQGPEDFEELSQAAKDA